MMMLKFKPLQLIIFVYSSSVRGLKSGRETEKLIPKMADEKLGGKQLYCKSHGGK